MEYRNPILIAQYENRIHEIEREIQNLKAKKIVIQKTNTIPPREELEALGLMPVKQKNLTLNNKIS